MAHVKLTSYREIFLPPFLLPVFLARRDRAVNIRRPFRLKNGHRVSDRGRNPFNGLFPLSKQNRIRLQPEECCRNWIGKEGENGVIVISKISFSRMAPFSGHPVRFCESIENSRLLSAVTKWARNEFTFDEMPHWLDPF